MFRLSRSLKKFVRKAKKSGKSSGSAAWLFFPVLGGIGILTAACDDGDYTTVSDFREEAAMVDALSAEEMRRKYEAPLENPYSYEGLFAKIENEIYFQTEEGLHVTLGRPVGNGLSLTYNVSLANKEGKSANSGSVSMEYHMNGVMDYLAARLDHSGDFMMRSRLMLGHILLSGAVGTDRQSQEPMANIGLDVVFQTCWLNLQMHFAQAYHTMSFHQQVSRTWSAGLMVQHAEDRGSMMQVGARCTKWWGQFVGSIQDDMSLRLMFTRSIPVRHALVSTEFQLERSRQTGMMESNTTIAVCKQIGTCMFRGRFDTTGQLATRMDTEFCNGTIGVIGQWKMPEQMMGLGIALGFSK